MNNVIEAFEFIESVFIQLTPRDLYLIEREYDINEDEHEELMNKLGENGWIVEENGTVTK